MNNKFKNTRIEFHILQSFPVSCLNRDDAGAPKTALIGGSLRARVSSQAWKRPVRLALEDFNVKIGIRSKMMEKSLNQHCIASGATPEQAKDCSAVIKDCLVKDTLLFFSDVEAKNLAEYARDHSFDPKNLKEKEIFKVMDVKKLKGLNSLDIALFGRMVAKAAELNVEAAASFAHAISVHKISNELDFFTAVDDVSVEDSSGSAHMGLLEYNSATYYRYVSLDLGQLCENIGDEDMEQAVEAFTKALFIALPTARQTTMSAASSWDYAKVLVRKGQRLQLSFDQPVTNSKNGWLEPAKAELNNTLDEKEKMFGSLFGKIAEYTIPEIGIDKLTESLAAEVRKIHG